MGFAVRLRSAGQKYGPTCHQRDRADVTEFVTLVRLSSLGQHVGILALAGYKRRKSALTAGPIAIFSFLTTTCLDVSTVLQHWLHNYRPLTSSTGYLTVELSFESFTPLGSVIVGIDRMQGTIKPADFPLKIR